jgi:hypothetical protein
MVTDHFPSKDVVSEAAFVFLLNNRVAIANTIENRGRNFMNLGYQNCADKSDLFSELR